MSKARLRDISDRLIQELHEIKGFHSDCIEGYKHYRDYVIKAQESKKRDEAGSIEELDQLTITFAHGKPSDPDVWIYNECTQGEFKARLDSKGSNEIRLSQLCIVMLYDKWEGSIRNSFSHALSVASIDSPIFGDIRHIRHDAVHHSGIATKEHSGTKCVMTKWFTTGVVMEITKDRFDQIIYYIFEWINKLFMSKYGEVGYSDFSLNPQAKKRHLKHMDFYKSMKTI